MIDDTDSAAVKRWEAERPKGRASELRINTMSVLCEQIDFVIAHPDIGGFDCSISAAVMAYPEAKSKALAYGMRGYLIKFVAVDTNDGRFLCRVLVVPPKKLSTLCKPK